MPGRLLIPQSATREAGKTMGVYKLTFPGSVASQESRLGTSKSTSSGFRNAFMGRRYHNVEYSNVAQARASSSLEAPEMEHFAAISEDDELRSWDESSSVFTASSAGGRTSNTISEDDDASLMEFASRASNTNLSDDDSSLIMEFAASRASMDFAAAAAQPARHSTACCSDLAFRRELRKRFYVVDQPGPVVDEPCGLRRDSTSSFTLGTSFRRDLQETEDRVESLALWEETDHRPQQRQQRTRGHADAAPHSWHAGDTAAAPPGRSSTASRSKGLDAILRKKKSSFTGFFSGLPFSSSRKSRKSLG